MHQGNWIVHLVVGIFIVVAILVGLVIASLIILPFIIMLIITALIYYWLNKRKKSREKKDLPGEREKTVKKSNYTVF